MAPTVLVTGATGFLGSHCVKLLLNQGYNVKGTVRSLKDHENIKHIQQLLPSDAPKDSLQLVEANLNAPESWHSAVEGCDYVLHVASPVIFDETIPPEEIINPAVEGTLAVLEACQQNGKIKRVVLTSSIAAITNYMKSNNYREKPYTEEDWTNLSEEELIPYLKGKTLAEKAAWDFMSKLGKSSKFELATINPSSIIGPLILPRNTLSLDIIKPIIENPFGLIPKLGVPIIDVRDVALAHVMAMHAPNANGKRHIVAGHHIWFKGIAEILQDEFKSQSYKIPPNKESEGGIQLPEMETMSVFCTTRMKDVLGIIPRPAKDSVLDTAYKMIDFGHIKND